MQRILGFSADALLPAGSDDFETALLEHLSSLRVSEPHAVCSTSSSLLPRQASPQGCPSGTLSYHKPCSGISDADARLDDSDVDDEGSHASYD